MKTDTLCILVHLLLVVMNAATLHSNQQLLESITEASDAFERSLWKVAIALGVKEKGVER